MHHAYALGQKVPTAEQARNADQCEDAEFDLVPIGMTRDARIAQAERRLGRFSVLKHDSFIGEAAVTGDALQGVSDDAMT
jgi:proline racemase